MPSGRRLRVGASDRHQPLLARRRLSDAEKSLVAGQSKMKFGIRLPSLKKKFAARMSFKRIVRHNFGLKAPRGLGWFTNPKKAAYNRVYSRTTVSADRLLRSSSGPSSAAGCGCLLLLGLGVVGMASTTSLKTIAWWTLGIGVVAVAVVISLARRRRLEQLRAADDARKLAAEEEGRARLRFDYLEARFGRSIAQAIWAHRYWQGATTEMIIESLGAPADVKEHVLKTKTKTTYCYRPIDPRRYALKVHFENGVVVGWDET